MGEALVAETDPASPSFGNAHRYRQTIAARANLACLLWIQGHSDRALEMINGAVADASSARNASSLCHLLSSCACPLAFWSGQDDLASQYIDLLAWETGRNAFAYMQSWADCYRLIWTARKERLDVSDTSAIRRVGNLALFDRQILVSIEARLFGELDLVDNSETQASWCTAEVLRAQGEHTLRSRNSGFQASAERLFSQSMVVAREQGALAWELRAGDLARLMQAE